MSDALIVCDLGYGDAGKGSVIDYIARTCGGNGLVVRHHGGAQAAHNVLTDDGIHHTFAQFGSATLVGWRTWLSKYMLVDLYALANEANHLSMLGIADPFSLLTIHEDALVITPWQKSAGRARELLREDGRHGSCGMGIGEVMHDLELGLEAVRMKDLLSGGLHGLLLSVRNVKRQLIEGFEDLTDPDVSEVAMAYKEIASNIRIGNDADFARDVRYGHTIFEGAQGILLDEAVGFHPYTTWSNTTPTNARSLLAEADYAGDVSVLGVLRSYMVRHGPGPFVTEDPTLEHPEPHNGTGVWQGPVRQGHLDAVALRYAVSIAQPEELVVTHLDAPFSGKVCTSYSREMDTIEGRRPVTYTDELLVPKDLEHSAVRTALLLECTPNYEEDDATVMEVVERTLDRPVVMESYGPTAVDKRVFTAKMRTP